jgi:hypothetical protein
MISCEDLYLDRLAHATVAWPREDVSYDSALEIALTNYARIDWDCIPARLKLRLVAEPRAGALMAGVNRRVHSPARRANVDQVAGRN